MSADDTYDERVARLDNEWGPDVDLSKPWFAVPPQRDAGDEGTDVSHWPKAGYVNEDGVTVSAAEAKVLGLSSEFTRLAGPVQAAVLEDRRRAQRQPDSGHAHTFPVPCCASPDDPAIVGLHPWTVEMLSAIADANEAYKDCE